MKAVHVLDQAAIAVARRANQRAADALSLLNASVAPRYNLCRALLSAHARENRIDGYEAERDKELRRAHAQHLTNGDGFYLDALDLAPSLGARADTAGSLAGGGYLIETTNVSYIELARPRSVTMTLGATVLPELVGNAVLPRMAASVTFGWMPSELAGTADSTQTFGQMNLTPHEISATLKISRLLALQATPAASALIASDIMAAIGQAIDVMAMGGSGFDGAPLGIIGTSGIGSVAGASFNYPIAVEMQAAVNMRLTPSGGYAAPSATATTLAKRLKDGANTSSYVWDGGLYNGQVAGNRAIASDNVPAGTVLYGSWEQLVIGQWGALQLEVSPVGTAVGDFQAGLIAVRVICALDVVVRDPMAFCVASGVT